MARIPQRFIDDLLDRVDIVDVVGSRIDLRKSGKNYAARCPFHDEKTPSFTVSPDKQFFYCFGCGAGGNAIGFIMDFDHLEFPQAVESLARDCGMEVPRDDNRDDSRDRWRRALYDLLARADTFYQSQLRQHPDAGLAVNYLRKRGLDGAIAKRFGIGFAPPGWDNLLTALSDNDQQVSQLLTSGLVVQKEDNPNRVYDRFRNRIMFPIRDTRGRTIGFGGRVLGDDKPKYLNSPETPVFHKGSELYGLYEAHKALREIPRLLVVEGYMDVVALAQYGIDNAVATLGTSVTAEHLSKLFRYTPEVVFCFDGDDAGRKAAKRALDTCLPAMEDGHSARFLFLPEGEDPDTLVRKLGAEGFAKLLADALPLSEFLFAIAGEELDLSTVDGKARLSRRAAPLINSMPPGVYRQLMLKQLAQRTDMDIDSLAAIIMPQPVEATPEPTSEIDGAAQDYVPLPDQYDVPGWVNYDDSHWPDIDDPRASPSPARPARRLKLPPIQRLILLLLHNPGLCTEVQRIEQLQRLDEPETPLLINLIELLTDKPDYSVNHILGYWRGIHGAEQGDLLARIAASDLAGNSEDDDAQRQERQRQECTDICRHLQKRIQPDSPAVAQLESLLRSDSLDQDGRKRALDLWLNRLTDEEKTPELNALLKQTLAKPIGAMQKS
ncbi:MAG: DNA primase [Porticoccaceae bacterium]|nr:DNA primase [Porticoccaceae bacterium]